MEVNGKLTIACERCGKTYDFLKEDVKFIETEKTNDEGESVWELKYDCLRCKNSISIKYQIAISKDGKIEKKNLDIQGAKVIEDSFEFINQ
ncbi:hypothetical protein [Prevotella sp. 10(H)]|uniref:hypothetical protein n=1 Tax=Prevotella sp. 10(H) TaxID=1158294 RepID=UPI0004A78589|nr:hypothetical protein [Prevotella sp. 10(H)]